MKAIARGKTFAVWWEPFGKCWGYAVRRIDSTVPLAWFPRLEDAMPWYSGLECEAQAKGGGG
jgi:hypothetical protein